MRSKLTLASLLIAGSLIAGALLYGGEGVTTESQQSAPAEQARGSESSLSLGAPGSDHAHISLLLFVDDAQVDLSQRRYMLRDQLVHLENDNGLVIHKHATGVTVPYYLSTLGMTLSEGCLTLDTGERYCDSGSKELRFIVNGDEIKDIASYEMRQGDRVLVNYGEEKGAALRLKFNQVPAVPPDFLPGNPSDRDSL